MAIEVQRLNPPGLANLKTFAQVATVRGGKTIYISGQVAWDEKVQVVGVGDLRAQAERVFENLKIALEAGGATYDSLVKLTTYVVNLKPEDRVTISEVRKRYIDPAKLPASTMVGVPSLVMPELLIEVEAVAVVD